MEDKLAQYLLDSCNELYKEYTVTRELFLERSQLYACLITIMKDQRLSGVNISKDEMIEAGKTLLKFTPSEDGNSVKLTLEELKEDTLI